MIYLFLAIVVFFVNVIPAFMPPTWIILAFFYTQFHLHIVPAVFLGASFATLGRICLAIIARSHFRRFIPKSLLRNYDSLGKFLNKHQKVSIPLFVSYAFLPIPSNHVYIIAGVTKVRLKLLAASFFIGRLISYSFWVNFSYHVSKYFSDVFAEHLSRRNAIIGELLGFTLLIFIGMINWKKLLHIK